MASLPNLRGQGTTPVYGSFPQDANRGGGAHSRYSTVTSESRYTPSARDEPALVQNVQESDLARSENAPGSGFASPEPSNCGYSPYLPPVAPVDSSGPPEEPEPVETTAETKAESSHERQTSVTSEKSSSAK